VRQQDEEARFTTDAMRSKGAVRIKVSNDRFWARGNARRARCERLDAAVKITRLLGAERTSGN